MQNLASGTQISPHLVDDVKLKEQLVLTAGGAMPEGDAIDDGPEVGFRYVLLI